MSKTTKPEDQDIQNSDHDGFFKEMLSYPEIRVPFLRRHLRKDTLEKINIEELCLQKETFLDEEYIKTASDLVFATKDKGVYVYMLLEHQSTPDPEIAYRFQKYEFGILEKFRKEFPGRKFPTIFQVLIYNGQKKYNISTKFWDMFEDPATRKNISDFGHELIDLQAMEDTLNRAEILEYFGKHLEARNRGILDLLENIWKKWYNVSDNEIRVMMIGVARYVAAYYPGKEKIENLFNKYGGKNMEAVKGSFAHYYIEQGKAEGKAEGIEKGIEKGKAEGIELAAKNMLKANADVIFVSKVTGLSLSKIEELKQNL
ncbi:Rpn family recombination-promoting nuclease/putative transposase [Rickettsia endosymbiont of Cardiosporidium cionae]|uniref:Rpn family recombination-promoting nuclease/putative transposase n=1 Tax=Rickettsia endosymbiont of Cardiosporidium cionae TaxID=2777155 RepID=UPI001895AE49|nr:Rpn family recombination-promoting nuclease/putative transposase [Rickettsia endosymbiont of Cardiosporidium cionae]KAF8818016.1 transposase [Rickettsia endosymbiont of Cardiosporidium cionae]